MDNTWIKLYRKIINSPIWGNEKALKVWIWCLIKASHEDREQLVGNKIINLKKGQFVFGRKVASDELQMTESSVYRNINLLAELKMLRIKPNNKFSVVTIEKYEDYQAQCTNSEQQKPVHLNIKRTPNEQQMNTNKNVKNVENIYLYFINKYNEENLRNLDEKMKFLRSIKEDENFNKLTEAEEYDLRDYILKN